MSVREAIKPKVSAAWNTIRSRPYVLARGFRHHCRSRCPFWLTHAINTFKLNLPPSTDLWLRVQRDFADWQNDLSTRLGDLTAGLQSTDRRGHQLHRRSLGSYQFYC